ncbi:hypothetical protein T01_8654 [Trichinella spiralis]|uniref:Uncharacterized protein n=1 Tax=Trichinella spiralis TaxID=6334 RepID=A0A0V1BG31_TRISP|nr:hypothetical protein T01_8654 [Trichinella spiralis]
MTWTEFQVIHEQSRSCLDVVKIQRIRCNANMNDGDKRQNCRQAQPYCNLLYLIDLITYINYLILFIFKKFQLHVISIMSKDGVRIQFLLCLEIRQNKYARYLLVAE